MSLELLAFRIPEKHAQRMIDSLNRDFYTKQNVFAIREPVIIDKEIIVCPMELPVPDLVKKMVLKNIFKGFKKSAMKKFINLKRVEITDDLKEKYEEAYKVELEKI